MSGTVSVSKDKAVGLNPDRELLWRSLCTVVSWWFKQLFGREPSESVRTGIAVALFLFCTYLMAVANVLTEKRNAHTLRQGGPLSEWRTEDRILPDLGFDLADWLAPWMSKDPFWQSLPDLGQAMLAGLMILWLVFDCPSKLLAIRRFLICHGLMFLGRAMCLICTQLPNPYSGYASFEFSEWPDWEIGRILVDALWVITRQKISSSDVFFSGHTVSMTLISLCIEYYSPKRRRWLIISVWVFTLLMLSLIILTKFHYSIDVLIAFFLCQLLWKVYHITINDPTMRRAFPVIRYLEGPLNQDSYSDSQFLLPSKLLRRMDSQFDKQE